ncbi:uncharacterized protein LOC126741818 [Anthonomus grandis grandis]|uniref:uncharacterized protein LOC126741818 n=1 Tax=Anthonomus grandis grandis TaxID=2921223 RepID=UPI002165F9A2|nr:uncharacterized protein LOC126741818 [Anthonomus grandis grandis]
MEYPDEPLNLTVKKMPIAIVAPFSRTEPVTTEKLSENNNETKIDNLNKNLAEFPQDLSLKNKKKSFVEDQCLDLTKNMIMNNKNVSPSPSEELRNYLMKNEESMNCYNRNVYSPSQSDSSSSKDKASPDIYSFMNTLDNKLLTAWYMNSIMAQPHQFVGQPKPAFDSSKPNSPSSNRILNNLLEKKPYTTYSFPSGFDALIKNEMREEEKDLKSPPGIG